MDPFGPSRHRNALLRRPAGNMASSETISEITMSEAHDHLGTPLHSHLNGKANSPKDCKPNSNPRRRRYPLQDITALVYPGHVNIHSSPIYEDIPSTRIPFPGRHPYQQHASSPRHNVAKLEALVLSSPKQQATINSKAKKHLQLHCLETGERAEGGAALQDSISISTESEKKDTIKKALLLRRRQLRRATNCIEIRKARI